MNLFPEKPISIQDKIAVAVARVNEAIDRFKPVAVFGLLSGGNDSLPATLVASLSKGFTAAVHINTGFGVEETRNFVRRTCEEQTWRLLEYKATENTNADGTPNPKLYEEIVLRFGFPGPNGHQFMYHHLKDRQLERLERDFGARVKYEIPQEVRKHWKSKLHGKQGWAKKMRETLARDGSLETHFKGRRVLYVSGVRSQESQRRMGSVEPIKIDGRRIWVAAIHDWSKLDCAAARLHAGLKQNIVCERIGMSGECLCGAFAKPGELEILRGWPETHPMYLRILALQEKAKAAGVHCRWGQAPSKSQKPTAEDEFNLFSGMEMPLCHNCTKHEGGRD